MDPEQFARFDTAIVPHLDAAHNLARHLTGNSADAEDVVQEACLRAIRHFHRFVGTDGRGWFLAITRNAAWDFLRRGMADRFVTLEEAPVDAATLIASDSIDADRSDQETHGIDWTLLDRAMQSLAAKFREVIVLRELEDLSYADIAAITGVPLGTVMSRLSRARRQLRQRLTAPPVETG